MLTGRLLPGVDNLGEYRKRVEDAIFPDPFSRKRVRVREAERLIRHYRLSTGDPVGTVDLMLAMIEAGTEQAVDLGYGDGEYFASLERVLRSVVDVLPSLPQSARPSIEQRLRKLAQRAQPVGWGYGDSVRDDHRARRLASTDSVPSAAPGPSARNLLRPASRAQRALPWAGFDFRSRRLGRPPAQKR